MRILFLARNPRTTLLFLASANNTVARWPQLNSEPAFQATISWAFVRTAVPYQADRVQALQTPAITDMIQIDMAYALYLSFAMSF